MNNSVERGRILCDKSRYPRFLRKIRRGIIFIVIVVWGCATIILGFTIWRIVLGEWIWIIMFGFFGGGSYFIGYYLWTNRRLIGNPVKVYENGIVVPPKNKRELEKGEIYIPFDMIKKTYIGSEIAFELKEGGFEYLNTKELPDIEAFISALKGRVEIETHARCEASGRLGGWVIWHHPDLLEIQELSFEMSWKDVKKRVMFDDIKSLDKWSGVTIVQFRDGSDFRVDLDRNMFRQLEAAWLEYQERYWRDPEAEEKRWERLEDVTK